MFPPPKPPSLPHNTGVGTIAGVQHRTHHDTDFSSTSTLLDNDFPQIMGGGGISDDPILHDPLFGFMDGIEFDLPP